MKGLQLYFDGSAPRHQTQAKEAIEIDKTSETVVTLGRGLRFLGLAFLLVAFPRMLRIIENRTLSLQHLIIIVLKSLKRHFARQPCLISRNPSPDLKQASTLILSRWLPYGKGQRLLVRRRCSPR